MTASSSGKSGNAPSRRAIWMIVLTARIHSITGLLTFPPSRASLSRVQLFSTTESQSTLAHTHFWGTTRSHDEIVHHVTQALRTVDANHSSQVQVISNEPPLVLIHNMLPSEQCQSIVRAAQEQELQRSTMNANQEQSQERTSSTAWLKEPQCEMPLRTFAEQVSQISGLPTSHMENLQVVRYLPGQEFAIHTDHLNSFNDLECRGRLATCLLYLQPPTRGGETRFFEFDANVSPQEGSAIFFWNTLERPGAPGYDPDMFLNVDLRLRHAGLPVMEGEKWICNRWIHPIAYGANVRGLHL